MTAGGGGAEERAPATEHATRTALVVAGSFAASSALALGLSRADGAMLWPALAFALAGAASGAFARRQVLRGRKAGPWVALAALNLALAVPELGLRSGGFRHVSRIEFGFPAPEQYFELVPDRELFWKLPPQPGLVNSLGFFGPEPRAPKPSGTFRVLYLGDSCSQLGYPDAWPELATRALATAGPGTVDEVNLALSGYSSHQGRVLAERHARELEPDVVAVYFGWNDHWLAWGAVDAEKVIDPARERLYRSLRLLQLARWAGDRWGVGAARPLETVRVPIGRYRDNLRAICVASEAAGARVVLTTAPSAHAWRGVPDYLVERSFVPDAESALRWHEAYNQVVREVAAERGAWLLDLEREIEARADRDACFLADGIHLTAEGAAAVARSFAALVRERATEK